ncbi:MAG: thioredoxin-disulfide reductase [Nanoarchaeota archaeon]|nr:thioredoxin-disulfide reductase [Nanoarchaeota archaeon]MBU1623188.1 thioredoxin-disulfide reductase [Nanoarchaeota archaeon]MBU1974405.1 thioredoxin-disulfide reductase [Nanoarchaeota archaeon]
MEKIVILGSGIAGCTAAIYASRAELKPLVLSGPEEGGQLMYTTEVDNFPGFPEGITGPDLVEKCKKQAERFGARFEYGIMNGFKEIKDGFELDLGKKRIQTKTLIIATGASARWLGIPSEAKYKGRGVSTCATCDGAFYKGKEVIIVGGGDVAIEEALFMTKFASKVTLVVRRDVFRASKIMQDKVRKNKMIKIVWNNEVVEYLGDDKFITGVKLKDTKTGKITDFKCEGVFLAIGHVPNTKFAEGMLKLNKGYLEANRFMHTSVEGVFAAGDVQDFKFRQAITAAGSGCMAAIEAEKYLAEKE